MNLAFLGAASVKLALFLSLFGVIASIWGALAGREDLIRSGKRATLAVWALMAIAVACLEWYLIRKDYALEYVAEEIDNSMPLYYRVTALWGGMNGSLLWWGLICATYTAACQIINRKRFKELMPWVTAGCSYVLAFLTFLVSFLTNPFTLLSKSDPAKGLIDLVQTTHDGKGLNPLLQTYWMTIHPPSLYTGYIGFTIPFAFCIAALVTRRVDGEFLRATRRWTLFAWMVLGFGILLGAKWAYEELGWGGYWGWDPVENASFMPWLCATAYVHSVIIQEKRGMLKGWNVFLILLTFTMTYFGTFLTRSGVVQSVHAFGSGPVGWVLGGFILSLAILCGYLIYTRRDILRAENEIESVLSREATFLYNNLGLLGFLLMVFVGTMFPVLSEAVKGNKIVVGPPFFNPLAGLITFGLLVLMGMGQLVAWRKTSPGAAKKNFTVPLWATCVAWLLLLLFLPHTFHLQVGGWTSPIGTPDPWALALFTGCVFVTVGIVWEYFRGASAVLSSHEAEIAALFDGGHGAPTGFLITTGMIFSGIGWALAGIFFEDRVFWIRLMLGGALGLAAIGLAMLAANRREIHRWMCAVSALFARNRRRYGGYVVHLGIVLVIAGIVGSSLFKLDKTITFKEGETQKVGEFDVTYTGLSLERWENPAAWRFIAYLKLEKNGRKVATAFPEKRSYDKGEQPTTEVSILENGVRDYYTILESATDPRIDKPGSTSKTATIRFIVSPLVEWLWFGGVICVIGTAVAAWPERKRVPVPVTDGSRVPAAGPAPQPAMAREGLAREGAP